MKGKGVRSWRAGLVGAAFLFGLGGLQAGLAPVPAAAQAAVRQITDCTTEGAASTAGTLAYAVAQGGTWAFACTGAGPFTIGFTSTLDVRAGKTVALEGLGAAVALSGGNSTELFTVEGALTLDGLILENSLAADGGGVDNSGTLTVSNCTFSGNSTNNSNGTGYGGAIYNAQTLTVSGSTFSGNSAGVGGAIANEGTAAISNSTLNANEAGTVGGAVFNGGTLTVSNSTFSGNAGTDGGAIENTSGGALTVSNSTFSGNRTAEGGGGAILNTATLTVSNSAFLGNSAAIAGAIANNMGTLTISNSTFSGNSAVAVVGAPPDGDGGAIFNSATLAISNSTLSGNSARSGGNLYGGGTLYNTIAANATSGGNCDGGTFTGGNDLEYGDTTCAGTGWATGNPELGAPASNGGPTQTMALGAGSAAIGAGDPAICAGAPVNGFDQRGVARGTTMATCDVGAYQATAPSQADLAAQYVVQPSPIAPPGMLAPGQTAAATVHTETSSGAMAPDVPVYLSLTGGTGSATVGGVALSATPQLFTSDGAGTVVVQYTAGTTPVGSGTDTITVADAATNPTLQASDSYSYVTFATLARLAGQFEAQPGIAKALSAKLGAAAAAAARGNTQALDGALGAFEHAVTAQAGKTITAAQAAVLIRQAQQLEQ